MRTGSRCAAALLAISCGSCGRAPITPRAPAPPPDPATSKPVGAGFYLTKAVGGERLPSVAPKVTKDFRGAPPTNDWWSSLIWSWDDKQPYSQPMFAHPLAMQAERGGLGIGYPTEVKIDRTSYFYPYVKDLLIGVDGLAAAETRVAGASDWAVTAAWADADGGMTATFGHGMPFVYVRRQGEAGAARAAVVEASADVKIWKRDGEAIGLTVGGHHYGLFAPEGATWTHDGRRLSSMLAGKDFFSVAVLPDASAATLELYRTHAYAFVTGTTVSWSYAEASATLTTRYQATTELLERGDGRVDEPLLALYRHQWLHTDATFTAQRYVSARGELKVLAGREFATAMPFHGVIPMLPLVDGGGSPARLRGLVDDIYQEDDLFPPGADGKRDSYWDGKSLGRITTAAQLADQLGMTRVRDQLVLALENQLQDWFDGQMPYAFYYDATWSTLIGFPSAYFSGEQLNDHHFHYGYFVMAAATVAQFDPAWAGRARWGEFVELLVKDAANWDREDARFPFLRHFDIYAGHSWANGPALFTDGNNQESSSEAMNFAAAVVLWGSVTGDQAMRDLGIYLYVTEIEATEQYWFDVDNAVFPEGFEPGVLGIVWSDGGKHDTWWDSNPVYVHGINWLPFTAASLYLSARAGLAERSYAELVEENGGDPLQWRDLAWMYLALSDPARASKLLAANQYFAPELGNSHAWLHHWIHTLAATGPLDPSVSADSPTATVLVKDGVRTYVAFNPGAKARTVKFSDGFSMQVPALKLVHARR